MKIAILGAGHGGVAMSSDLKLQGDGWKLVREDEPQINPELEKLKDLL